MLLHNLQIFTAQTAANKSELRRANVCDTDLKQEFGLHTAAYKDVLPNEERNDLYQQLT